MKTLINKRSYFLDKYYLMKKVTPLSFTSVKYKEAVFYFSKKIREYVEEPAREIFALSEECYKALSKRKEEIRLAGIPFATEPVKNNEPYKIDSNKMNEFNEVVEKINAKYASYLEQEKKMDEEFNAWLDKKISVDIEQVPVSEIPSFEHNGKESQYAFIEISEILGEDISLNSENDCKEV